MNSSIAVQDVLEELDNLATLILVDSAGLLHFIYQGELLTRTSEEIFGNISAALPPLIPVLGNSMPIPLVLPNGTDLDRVDLKSGNFIFYAENPNPQPVNVLITIPELLRDGQPFSIPFSIPAYSGSGARPSATNAPAPASLQGYSFRPEGIPFIFRSKRWPPATCKSICRIPSSNLINLPFPTPKGFWASWFTKENRIR